MMHMREEYLRNDIAIVFSVAHGLVWDSDGGEIHAALDLVNYSICIWQPLSVFNGGPTVLSYNLIDFSLNTLCTEQVKVKSHLLLGGRSISLTSP